MDFRKEVIKGMISVVYKLDTTYSYSFNILNSTLVTYTLNNLVTILKGPLSLSIRPY
jgi:hypothetical protein